ncbi:ThiF family adenylyltransferase [Novosphingobium terrae]|uniref:ThiF family adenylyltransferase n=1 Tax=Novosphingobium terrae TaxID=2726189 RepID=UPI00197DD4A3|nr:ThiF family adenylyltransferase [Novosphingobium terrae]
MSHALIRANPDLSRLVEDGYDVEIVGGYLVLRDIPFVTADRRLRRGSLVCLLQLAGDRTVQPRDHNGWFAGGTPHTADGCQLDGMLHDFRRQDLGGGLLVDHFICCFPPGGYFDDHHHKMTTLAEHVSVHAAVIEPTATARTGHVMTGEGRSCFEYLDTASSRNGIGRFSDRLAGLSIGIVGLGGTGSYILDQIAKTPVGRIHLFDDDRFDQHCAFRAPGAPSIEELRALPSKVAHFARLYSRMHRGIVGHEVRLGKANAGYLDHVDFVFLAVDDGAARHMLVKELEKRALPFIDTGIGLESADGGLTGMVRVTTSTPEMRDHVRQFHRAPLASGGAGIYESRAQVSDMNALTAVLAVIRFKKHFGFYLDLEGEHHTVFQMDGATIINEDFKERET